MVDGLFQFSESDSQRGRDSVHQIEVKCLSLLSEMGTSGVAGVIWLLLETLCTGGDKVFDFCAVLVEDLEYTFQVHWG